MSLSNQPQFQQPVYYYDPLLNQQNAQALGRMIGYVVTPVLTVLLVLFAGYAFTPFLAFLSWSESRRGIPFQWLSFRSRQHARSS